MILPSFDGKLVGFPDGFLGLGGEMIEWRHRFEVMNNDTGYHIIPDMTIVLLPTIEYAMKFHSYGLVSEGFRAEATAA